MSPSALANAIPAKLQAHSWKLASWQLEARSWKLGAGNWRLLMPKAGDEREKRKRSGETEAELNPLLDEQEAGT